MSRLIVTQSLNNKKKKLICAIFNKCIHFRRWKPELANEVPIKVCKHRALDDIRESIQELQFYKSYLKL